MEKNVDKIKQGNKQGKQRNNHKNYIPKKYKKYLLCHNSNEDGCFTKDKKYPLVGCKTIKGELRFIIKDDNNTERYICLGSSEAKFELISERDFMGMK